METIGLNMLPLVTDAALDRMQSRASRSTADQRRRLADLAGQQLRPRVGRCAGEDGAVRGVRLVDPNNRTVTRPDPGAPRAVHRRVTPGLDRKRAAGLKVWQDDLTATTPLVGRWCTCPTEVHSYAAPTRIYAQTTRTAPGWR
jgi:hypothetical protein